MRKPQQQSALRTSLSADQFVVYRLNQRILNKDFDFVGAQRVFFIDPQFVYATAVGLDRLYFNYFEFPHLVLQVVPINALAALAA
jgi:hypothetical protein